MKGIKNVPMEATSLRWILASLTLVLLVGLSACAPGAIQTATMAETSTPQAMDENPTETMMEVEQAGDAMPATHEPMMSETETPEMMEATVEPMMDESQSTNEDMVQAPNWFSVSLDDVNTDNNFNLQDFNGKVVLVETMAVWCSNCLQQQRQVKALHELIGERDDFVSLALDIDPNENADDLKSFVDRNGFDWVYAVAPAEVAREIGNLYGAQFLNPPSTPMLIVDRHGEVHPLPFGIKDAQTLKEALDSFLTDDM